MRIIRIWNPISCIPYRLEVTLFMNRPILVLLYGKESSVYFYPLSEYIYISALRLLALRGLRTLRIRRVTQWALGDIRETIRRFLVLYAELPFVCS